MILAVLCCVGGTGAWAEERAPCGDDHVVCGGAERCCEHPIATFCENQGCASVYVHGECIPQGQSCRDFWCGNRHCQTGWFLSNEVCCVYNREGAPASYSCTSSELSCPGNTQQLTIRPKVATRKLQGESE